MAEPPESHSPRRRKRVLFVAESATLAHLARPYALARGLSPEKWEIVFACADNYLDLFPEWTWERKRLHSLTPHQFVERLARGERVYSLAELKQYAAEDLRLLDQVRPDVVVGDFRLSLSASARIARIPYVAVTNAYWSPHASRRHFPVPNLPLTGIVGLPIASTLFRLARPMAFAWHAAPLDLLRRSYGLPSLGLDLRRAYTDADLTLYADVPQLVPTTELPSNHQYIGPVEWSPAIAIPSLPPHAPDFPLVYVTLGSSGSSSILPLIIDALAPLDCHVAIAAPGWQPPRTPPNVTIADYLPGDRMCQTASLVICNGGSPTSHQAIARGVPVLGVPFNLDQHLNMDCLVAYGAGLSIRPEIATASSLRAAVRMLLGNTAFKRQATELAKAFSSYRSNQEFSAALDRINS